jgi:hypothetical protein
MMTSDTLEKLRQRIATKLVEISDMFERPNETRITIVIRTPWLADGGVLLSDDNFDEAIVEIQRLRIRDEVSETGCASQPSPSSVPKKTF